MCKEFGDVSLYSPWYHQNIQRIQQKPTLKACDLRSLRQHCNKIQHHSINQDQELIGKPLSVNSVLLHLQRWLCPAVLCTVWNCRNEIVLCPRVCTCRQSARRCSSLWGRARRGDRAPSDSSRICGPWHSTWRHVSLCTLRLLGFPSLLNRKDLQVKKATKGN